MMFLRGRIDRMTCAEIHTIMTSSFAVISGSNLAVYIMYGVSVQPALLNWSKKAAENELCLNHYFV